MPKISQLRPKDGEITAMKRVTLFCIVSPALAIGAGWEVWKIVLLLIAMIVVFVTTSRLMWMLFNTAWYGVFYGFLFVAFCVTGLLHRLKAVDENVVLAFFMMLFLSGLFLAPWREVTKK